MSICHFYNENASEKSGINIITRWVAVMIQLDVHVRIPRARKFVGGWWWWVADTNYLYPARWGWINYTPLCIFSCVYETYTNYNILTFPYSTLIQGSNSKIRGQWCITLNLVEGSVRRCILSCVVRSLRSRIWLCFPPMTITTITLTQTGEGPSCMFLFLTCVFTQLLE